MPCLLWQRSTGKRPSLKSGFSNLRDFAIEQSVFYSPVPSLDIAVLNEPPILASPSDRSSTNKFSTGIGCWWQRVREMNEWSVQCVSSKRASNFRSLRVSLVNCTWRSGRKEESAKYLLDSLRLHAVFLLVKTPRGRQSRSQSFVTLDQRSVNESSGSN